MFSVFIIEKSSSFSLFLSVLDAEGGQGAREGATEEVGRPHDSDPEVGEKDIPTED